MSEFSTNWVGCMKGHGIPVPDLETLGEALEYIDQVHSAWENAGGGDELLIGALIAAGAFVGADEVALAALSAAAQISAMVYLAACIVCLASAALGDLISLNQEGALPEYVVTILQEQGTDLNGMVA